MTTALASGDGASRKARADDVTVGPPVVRQRALVSPARAAFLALRSTGFRLWLCSIGDGALQLVSGAGTQGQASDLGHIHADDMALVSSRYQAALIGNLPFDLECRISDSHGAFHLSRCWFGLRLGRGGDEERIIMIEKPLGEQLDPEGQQPQPLRTKLEHDDDHDAEFLAFIAHQLRSPVTTIMGNAHLLRFRTRDLTQAQRRQALEDLVDSTDHLCRLLDDLLRLTGVVEVSRSDDQVDAVSLPEIVADVLLRHAKLDPHRVLRLTEPASLPAVRGSSGYVDQIVDNLITNARKYSPADTPIDILLESDSDHVRVRVLDRGAGLDATEAERIFAPFYRSARVSGFAEGSGIGLAVCRRLARALGGLITAQPRPGGGSEFVLTLRRARQPADRSIPDFLLNERDRPPAGRGAGMTHAVN
jgi:signal transduction histidine kinase